MSSRIIVLIILLSSGIVYADNKNIFESGFIVKDMQGEVFAWPAFGNSWSKIGVGSKIPMGTLLKIPEAGIVRLQIPEQLLTGSLLSKNNIVTFKGIEYIRLDDLLIRKVNMSPLFLSTIPEKIQKIDGVESVHGVWENAWSRIVALVDPDGQKTENIKEKQKHTDEGFSISDDVIKKFPLDVTVRYEAGKKGASVAAKWANDPNIDIYDIYIWAKGRTSDVPFNSVKTNFSIEHLYDSGEFSMKIASRDLRKQSNVVTFIVDDKNVDLDEALISQKRHLRILSPKENQIIFAKRSKIEVDFSFETTNEYLRIKPTYYLLIKDLNHSLVAHVRVDEPGVSYPLEWGEYEWCITSEGELPADLKHVLALSPWRKLAITDFSQKKSLNISAREFKNILNSEENTDVKIEIK